MNPAPTRRRPPGPGVASAKSTPATPVATSSSPSTERYVGWGSDGVLAVTQNASRAEPTAFR